MIRTMKLQFYQFRQLGNHLRLFYDGHLSEKSNLVFKVLRSFKKRIKVRWIQIDSSTIVHRICTLSVQLFSDVTSVNSVFVVEKIVSNNDNFKIKCFPYTVK